MTAKSAPMNLKRVTRRLAPLLLLFFLAACSLSVLPPTISRPASLDDEARSTDDDEARPLLPDVEVVSSFTVNRIELDEVTLSAKLRKNGTATASPYDRHWSQLQRGDRNVPGDGNVAAKSAQTPTTHLPLPGRR